MAWMEVGRQAEEIERLITAFPGLVADPWEFTSPETPRYNCIAWAAGDTSRVWWPVDPYYWPPDAEKALTALAFLGMFESLGYKTCDGSGDPRNVERVAMFTKDGRPTHAARQLGKV